MYCFISVSGVPFISSPLAPNEPTNRLSNDFPKAIEENGPIATLAGLTSAGERAISFWPSEVDFLFAGPFTRRELLIYKLSSTIAGALFTSLILSASLAMYLS